MAIAGFLMFGDQVAVEITSSIFRTQGYPHALSICILVFIIIIPLTKIPLKYGLCILTRTFIFFSLTKLKPQHPPPRHRPRHPLRPTRPHPPPNHQHHRPARLRARDPPRRHPIYYLHHHRPHRHLHPLLRGHHGVFGLRIDVYYLHYFTLGVLPAPLRAGDQCEGARAGLVSYSWVGDHGDRGYGLGVPPEGAGWCGGLNLNLNLN